jgi:hypothetical protein
MSAFDWIFRNRETGEITIAQMPNAPLLVFLAAWLLRAVIQPTGTFDTVLAVVAVGALLVWGALELVWGVNPWRRFLGGVVIAGQIVLLLLR